MLTLRPCRPDDLGAVRAAIRSADELVMWAGASTFTWPLTDASLRRYLRVTQRGDSAVWTAVDGDGRVVGHAKTVASTDGLIHLGHILVLPARRGPGLGAALVDELVAQARSWGARRVALNVYDVNAPARRAYERAGFTVVAERPGAHRDRDGRVWANLRMELTVDPVRV